MAILSKNEIKSNINTELADNNAGMISAYDVRHNLEDIVDSINQIVASGDFDVITPFTGSNVRAAIKNNQFGKFIAESGVEFPNGGGTQYTAYPGPTGIQHNTLAGLNTGDPHLQYMPRDGVRIMEDNLGLGSNWINSSGNTSITTSDNRGLKFEYISNTVEKIHIGSGSIVTFDKDGSSFDTGKGVAKAWINFDASGVAGSPSVRSAYNIHTLEKLDVGKFKIYFTSGVLGDNNYVAVGHSNSRSTSASEEDFEINTVGMVMRSGDDAAALRNLTFCVLNANGEYVDANVNDIIVFGLGVDTSSAPLPNVI